MKSYNISAGLRVDTAGGQREFIEMMNEQRRSQLAWHILGNADDIHADRLDTQKGD